MAIMYPSSIESYSYTESEKYFYNLLKSSLSDDFRVFYSIRWFKEVNGKRENSECDFLIFHPSYGYLTIEVKGGVKMEVEGEEWRIFDSYSSDSYRVLRRSPFKQAEESMYYFKDYYEEEFASLYEGTYGFAVAFPNYSVNTSLGVSYPNFLIIDNKSLGNLQENIIRIFKHWRGRLRRIIPFSESQQEKFLKMLNKRISLSAAAGALLDLKHKELENVNRIQESYLDFISNYNKAFIIGGAGTGKTWIGIKKAILDVDKGRKVLIVAPNKLLADYIKVQFSTKDITVKCFEEIQNEEKAVYDTIIVDEAQDFNEAQAEIITDLLKNKQKSTLYVMYDDNQRIFDVDFKDKFDIQYPQFCLKDNIRNTSAIHDWCVLKTGIGRAIRPSLIEGVEPEESSFNHQRAARLKIEEILNALTIKECVSNKSIVVLSDVNYENSILKDSYFFGRYTFVEKNEELKENAILFKVDEDFKGLESDIVIYLKHKKDDINNLTRRYISYTRARFYLYVINIKI